jgi:hypothetical protein
MHSVLRTWSGRAATLLALALCWFGGFGLADTPDARDPLIARGLLSVSLFGATANDDSDDTAAILATLAAARDRGLATYLPSGTFLVSDSLKCFQRARDNGRRLQLERRKPCVIVGSSIGDRSVLRLLPKAPGFDDAANPKPVIWFWAQSERGPRAGSESPQDGDPTVSFNQVIKSVDIDLRGAGHSGAVGIRHAGSQGSTIEDVSVFADGAFAGLYDTPGQGGGVYDFRVYGGRYGVFATSASRYPLLVGCRFIRQDQAAIDWSGNVVFALVGFAIEKTSVGPAITVQPGGPIYGRGFVLVDGTIASVGPVAIDNSAGKALTLSNVYFSRSQAGVRSGDKPPIPVAGSGTQVLDYTYTGFGYLSLIEGETKPAGFERVRTTASAPPAAEVLIRRHLWDLDFPSFDDPALADVRRYGARPDDQEDDTDAIQKALDNNSKVLIPKGVFLISRPLVLGASNALVGVAKTHSVLRESTRWDGAEGTALVTTVADAKAAPSLSFVLLETQSTARTALHWRAGGASIVRDIMVGPVSAFYGKRVSNPGQTFRISDSGGGRWFAVAAEWGNIHGATHDPRYYHLLVEGTNQPLAFYGLNLERDAVWPQAIIRDSANIDIFYFKTEADEWKGRVPAGVLLMERSRKIRLFGMTGNAHPPGASLVTVDGGDAIQLSQVAGFKLKHDFANVVEIRSGGSRQISGDTPLALFERQSNDDARK